MQGARRSHRETAAGAGGLFRRGSPETGGGAGLSSRTGVNRLASWDQLSGQTLQQQLAEVLDKVWLQQREHDELTNAVRALQQQQLDGSSHVVDTFTAVDVEAQVNACLASLQSSLDAHIAEGLRQQQDQLHHALKLVVGSPTGSAGQVEPGSLENRVCDIVLESSRQSSRMDGVVAQVRLLQERLDTMQGSQEHVMKVLDRLAGSHSRKDNDSNSVSRIASPRADVEDCINDAAHLLKELKEERNAVLDMMDGLRTHKLEVIAMLHTFQMDKQEALKDLEAIWHAVRTDLAHVEVIKGELGGVATFVKDESMDATNGVPERKARVGSISPERRPRATSTGVVTKGGGLTVPAPTAAVMQPHNYSPKAVPRGHSMQYLEGAAKSQQNLRLRPGGVQRFPSAGCLSARDVTQVTAPPDLSPAAGLRRTSTRPTGSNVADYAPSPGAGAGALSAPQSAMASSPQRCGACQVSRMSSTALVSGAANQSIGSATVLTSPQHSISQQSPVVVHSNTALGTSCASVSRMSSAQQQGSMLTQATASSPQGSAQQCPVVSRMSSSSVHLGQLASNAGVLSQTLTMRSGW
mmetsp:Transcript_20026/g.36144  ORF Transcript_20026/g.36144 Transcript_20026/m.36144 type:complete len:581 (+) Transcript_20026:104-1846(+)